jgi:hypothetical protein
VGIFCPPTIQTPKEGKMSLLSDLFFGRTEDRITAELGNWAQENDQRLPMSADEIAVLESQGYLVDLETGAVSRDPDAQNIIHNN